MYSWVCGMSTGTQHTPRIPCLCPFKKNMFAFKYEYTPLRTWRAAGINVLIAGSEYLVTYILYIHHLLSSSSCCPSFGCDTYDSHLAIGVYTWDVRKTYLRPAVIARDSLRRGFDRLICLLLFAAVFSFLLPLLGLCCWFPLGRRCRGNVALHHHHQQQQQYSFFLPYGNSCVRPRVLKTSTGGGGIKKTRTFHHKAVT